MFMKYKDFFLATNLRLQSNFLLSTPFYVRNIADVLKHKTKGSTSA